MELTLFRTELRERHVECCIEVLPLAVPQMVYFAIQFGTETLKLPLDRILAGSSETSAALSG